MHSSLRQQPKDSSDNPIQTTHRCICFSLRFALFSNLLQILSITLSSKNINLSLFFSCGQSSPLHPVLLFAWFVICADLLSLSRATLSLAKASLSFCSRALSCSKDALSLLTAALSFSTWALSRWSVALSRSARALSRSRRAFSLSRPPSSFSRSCLSLWSLVLMMSNEWFSVVCLPFCLARLARCGLEAGGTFTEVPSSSRNSNISPPTLIWRSLLLRWGALSVLSSDVITCWLIFSSNSSPRASSIRLNHFQQVGFFSTPVGGYFASL